MPYTKARKVSVLEDNLAVGIDLVIVFQAVLRTKVFFLLS